MDYRGYAANGVDGTAPWYERGDALFTRRLHVLAPASGGALVYRRFLFCGRRALRVSGEIRADRLSSHGGGARFDASPTWCAEPGVPAGPPVPVGARRARQHRDVR